MIKHAAILLVLLTMPVATIAGAYKCTINGKTHYQQSPCVGDGQEIRLNKESEGQKLNRQIDSLEATQRRAELEQMADQVERQNAQNIRSHLNMLENQRRTQEQIDYHQHRAEEMRVLEEESKTKDKYLEVWSRNRAAEQEKAADSLK